MSQEKPKDPKQQLSEAAEKLQQYAKPVVNAITVALPVIIKYSKQAYAIYKKLPQHELAFLTGFVFCFFGGLYPVCFAAAMAAEYGGRQTIVKAVGELADEAIKILDESKKDDDKDDDGDGKKDVDQIASKEFVQRKTLLVLRKMNPEKVDTAVKSIYTVWLSVAAVLSIQFARTISFALAIAEFLNKPMERFVAPAVKEAIPNEYDRWVPVVMGWICKGIAMSVAWYLQAIKSAFASAMKGGLMMSRSIYAVLLGRGIDLGGLIKEDHNDTNIDEIMSYGFAFMGFYFQFKLGFDMPFPLNLLLFPLEFCEWFIRWSVTST